MNSTSRLAPRTAIVLSFYTGVLTLLVDQPVSLMVVTGLAGLYWLTGRNRRHWKLLLAALALGTWSIGITQGLFYQGWPRTVLFTLIPAAWFPLGDPPGLYVFREGLVHGLVQSLRLDVMVLLGAGLLGRYATDDLTRGLAALRIPAALGFLFSIALRYLPMMVAELRAVWTAQRLRGLRLGGGTPLHLARQGRVLLMPLLAATIRKSDEIAAALHSRGFTAAHMPPEVEAAVPLRERLVSRLGLLALLALLVAFTLTRLHVGGLYSSPGLMWLYILVLDYV